MKLRQAVGAHQGLSFWVGQMLSAVIMLVCLVWLLVAFALMQPSGHAGLVEFVTANHVRVPAALGMLMLVWHAWLGAKSVVMDYITAFGAGVRVFKYVALICYLLLCFFWLLGIMWGAR